MATTRKRPRAKARLWYWVDDTTKTDGIGLFSRDAMLAHFTGVEARTMADRLHDLADQLKGGPPVTELPPEPARPSAGIRNLRHGRIKRAMPGPSKQPPTGWNSLPTEASATADQSERESS